MAPPVWLPLLIPAARGYTIHETGLPKLGTGTRISRSALQLLAQPLTYQQGGFAQEDLLSKLRF